MSPDIQNAFCGRESGVWLEGRRWGGSNVYGAVTHPQDLQVGDEIPVETRPSAFVRTYILGTHRSTKFPVTSWRASADGGGVGGVMVRLIPHITEKMKGTFASDMAGEVAVGGKRVMLQGGQVNISANSVVSPSTAASAHEGVVIVPAAIDRGPVLPGRASWPRSLVFFHIRRWRR